MARTPSGNVLELETLIGPKGEVIITSANRALVQKWLTASGVRALMAKQFSLVQLGEIYNDHTLEKLNNAIQASQNMPAYEDREERPSALEVTEHEYKEIPVDLTRLGKYPQYSENPWDIQNPSLPSPLDPTSELQNALSTIMRMASQPKVIPAQGISQEQLDQAVHKAVKDQLAKPINITIKDHTHSLPAELRHKDFTKILTAVTCGNVALIGPAGSGKTTLAEQIAKALNVPFKFTGAISSEYKLTGFIDAHGRVIHTAFREAYENGGLFLFDEIDGSLPGAVLAFNAALANGHADFPDGSVSRHKDFYCMAAANTYWTGAEGLRSWGLNSWHKA